MQNSEIKFSTVQYSDRKSSAIQCKSSVQALPPPGFCCCYQIEPNAVLCCAVQCNAMQCTSQYCTKVQCRPPPPGFCCCYQSEPNPRPNSQNVPTHCTQCTDHTAHCTQYTLRSVHCTHCALNTAHSAHCVRCAAHTAHCTLY